MLLPFSCLPRYVQRWAVVSFDLPSFPQCLPWGNGAVVHIQPPQTAKEDAAVTLAENIVLPKTLHPSDEFSCLVERNRVRNSSQPATDIIISHLSQAGVAGQVYLRIILRLDMMIFRVSSN